MSDRIYIGGCMCGGVRYEASGAVRNLCFCHCTDCRRAVGAPAVPWGTVDLENFNLVKGKPAEYRSSAKVVRGFCAQCGTSLTYRHEGRAAEIDFTLVSLDKPTLLKPERHIWTQDELPWATIGDTLPRFAKTAAGKAE